MIFRYHILPTMLFVLLSLGCTSSPGAQNAPSEPDQVKGVILPFLTFAPFFIAEEEGYFAEQNIDIEFVELQQGVQAVPQLLLGNIDVSAGLLDAALLNGIHQGVEARTVATGAYLAGEGCTYLAVVQNKTNPLRTYEDAAIGHSLNGYLAYYLDTLLRAEGLSLDGVESVNLPAPGRVAALADGSIDAAVVGEPQITSLLADANGEIVHAAEALLVDSDYTFVYFSPTFIAERPMVGERFMTAYLKGVRQFAEGKTPRNIEIIAANTTLDAERLEQLCWPTFRTDGQLDFAGVLAYQSWLAERDVIDAVVPLEQFWDGRFVRTANASLDGE